MNGLSPAVNTSLLPALLCIWSVCSQVAGLYTDLQHLKLPSSPSHTSLRSTRIYADCLLYVRLPYMSLIPVDSSRHVTAGSETKLEQRQVKPSRSHVFLKASVPFSPHRDIQNYVCVKFVVSFGVMAHLQLGNI